MIQSEHLYFRLIQEEDVDFLLSLRLNQNLNKHLSKVSDDREHQLEWLRNYKIHEISGIDYYFVIVDKILGPLGLVRLYGINYAEKSFTWGSWIIREDGRPKYAALESAILVYEFAYNELELFLAKFEVRNENTGVINFHNRFGARFLYKDEINHYFEISKTNYIQLKYNQYYKYLIF